MSTKEITFEFVKSLGVLLETNVGTVTKLEKPG